MDVPSDLAKPTGAPARYNEPSSNYHQHTLGPGPGVIPATQSPVGQSLSCSQTRWQVPDSQVTTDVIGTQVIPNVQVSTPKPKKVQRWSS